MGPPFALRLGSNLQEKVGQETHPKGPRTQIMGSKDPNNGVIGGLYRDVWGLYWGSRTQIIMFLGPYNNNSGIWALKP